LLPAPVVGGQHSGSSLRPQHVELESVLNPSESALQEAAGDAFKRHIVGNSYPGRGLVVGNLGEGRCRLVYWIMGRSAHSQNRRFEANGGVLRTVPVDESKVEDPSLIIYEAMLELPGVQLVSNGDQTRTLRDALTAGGDFSAALETREREPDAPNYTPRISAIIDYRQGAPRVSLSLLKASRFDASQTDRITYRPALPTVGYGLCLTTYRGDGQPLPSFEGDPLVLPCGGSAREVLGQYWQALDAGNRVSLAVKDVAADGSCEDLLVENRHA
jgi:hypothetical protein